ncbi:MAG: dihydroxyacetone kinase subunit L [Synergistaceae bacterium]|nr:dihydroxyacetone kinase subunit L [Synergistaceae bacterium]
MNVTKDDFKLRLAGAADALLAKYDYLSVIDARFGDGDHGISIKKIAELMKRECSEWSGASFGAFFEKLSRGILGISGGASSPLWGTMFGGFSLPLGNKQELTSPDIVKMFSDGLKELQDITAARIGDKTMMDVFIPVVETVKGMADESPGEIFKAIAEAAERGCKATEGFAAKFGRAKNYKEQTIGTPDAGAVSLAEFFTGLDKDRS